MKTLCNEAEDLKPVTVHLPTEMHTALKHTSIETNRSVSAIVEEALTDWLQEIGIPLDLPTKPKPGAYLNPSIGN